MHTDKFSMESLRSKAQLFNSWIYFVVSVLIECFPQKKCYSLDHPNDLLYFIFSLINFIFVLILDWEFLLAFVCYTSCVKSVIPTSCRPMFKIHYFISPSSVPKIVPTTETFKFSEVNWDFIKVCDLWLFS